VALRGHRADLRHTAAQELIAKTSTAKGAAAGAPGSRSTPLHSAA